MFEESLPICPPTNCPALTCITSPDALETAKVALDHQTAVINMTAAIVQDTVLFGILCWKI